MSKVRIATLDIEIGDIDFLEFQNDSDDITLSQACMEMDNGKSADEGLGTIGISQTFILMRVD